MTSTWLPRRIRTPDRLKSVLSFDSCRRRRSSKDQEMQRHSRLAAPGNAHRFQDGGSPCLSSAGAHDLPAGHKYFRLASMTARPFVLDILAVCMAAHNYDLTSTSERTPSRQVRSANKQPVSQCGMPMSQSQTPRPVSITGNHVLELLRAVQVQPS